MRKLVKFPEQVVVNYSTVLRIMKSENAAELFDVVERNRPRLTRWLPWVPDTKCVADSLSFINNSRQEIIENKSFPYGIWFEDRLVGVAGAVAWDVEKRTIEIGAWIDADHEGKGIILAAFVSLSRVVFDQTDIETITALAEPTNRSSNAVLRRFGFNLIGQTEKTDNRGQLTCNVYELKRPD